MIWSVDFVKTNWHFGMIVNNYGNIILNYFTLNWPFEKSPKLWKYEKKLLLYDQINPLRKVKKPGNIKQTVAFAKVNWPFDKNWELWKYDRIINQIYLLKKVLKNGENMIWNCCFCITKLTLWENSKLWKYQKNCCFCKTKLTFEDKSKIVKTSK